MPDAIVTGSFRSGVTSATIIADLTCTRGRPTGSVIGTMELFTGTATPLRLAFTSNSPRSIAALRRSTLTSVGADFLNVTVITGTTIVRNARLIFDATRATRSTGTWTGQIVLVLPTGTVRRVYGVFVGSVIVNRNVICTLPL